MWWTNFLKRHSKPIADSMTPEATKDDRSHWLGNTLFGMQTLRLTLRTGDNSILYWPNDVKSVVGRVTAIGENSVKVNGEWYELDCQEVGGLRVVDIIPSDTSADYGTGVLVKGKLVAWFIELDSAIEWASEKHPGQWLTRRAVQPKEEPFTQSESEAIAKAADVLRDKARVTPTAD